MSRPTVLLLLAASLLAADAFGQSPFETKPKQADKPAPADSAAPGTASSSENPELKAMAGAEGRGRKPGEAGSPSVSRDRFAEFAKAHPELKEAIEKLKAMTPEERQAWLKEHPEAAEKIEKAKGNLRERAQNLTPEQQEQLKARMKERFEKLSPEERAELLKKRPELKEKLGDAAK
jgi:hypothetical protein